MKTTAACIWPAWPARDRLGRPWAEPHQFDRGLAWCDSPATSHGFLRILRRPMKSVAMAQRQPSSNARLSAIRSSGKILTMGSASSCMLPDISSRHGGTDSRHCAGCGLIADRARAMRWPS
jgi:hypothetical protein